MTCVNRMKIKQSWHLNWEFFLKEKIKWKGFEKKDFDFNLIWTVFCLKCPGCCCFFFSFSFLFLFFDINVSFLKVKKQWTNVKPLPSLCRHQKNYSEVLDPFSQVVYIRIYLSNINNDTYDEINTCVAAVSYLVHFLLFLFYL